MGCLAKVRETVRRSVAKRLNYTEVGRLVKHERQKNGIGLREAARQAKVSHATWSRVERGGMPDVQTLYAMFRWCEWSEWDLVWALRSLATREKPNAKLSGGPTPNDTGETT